MWFLHKENGVLFTLRSKQDFFYRRRQLRKQLESGELRENIHQLKCAKYREEFEKFVDEFITNLNYDL
jgi:chemotaxis methyl-accepting protein methylase